MVIDDDSDDRTYFIKSLSVVEPEIKCLQASNGKEGLAVLDNHTELPNVIFMDINMPVMTGWECLTNLKKHDKYKEIPVVIFSTSSHQRDVNIAFDLGACSYCVKPDEPADVKGVLKFVAHSLDNDFCEPVKKNLYPEYFQFPTIY